jgi:hypothetical protein
MSDSQADIDNDSLTNRDEIDRGTNPVDSDSDYDTLNDGEEVNSYGTDPLKYDTDGDGVSDSDELQLGLNPTATATNGIPDNEHTFEQTLSADSEPMEYINGESELEFSIQITSAGVAENNITASESGYSTAMSNPAIIGVIPEFTYSDGLTVSEFTLGVKIPDNLVQNTIGTYADENDEFAGIKRFNFFRFFEEINTLLPVETTFDISTNMMYTKTDDLGTYCVIDMEIWLESLTEGMETESETETIEEDTPDDQGGSLPENTVETVSIVETMSMSKSVMRTASLSSTALLGENTPVVTMADNAQSNEEYNVIFCVDTRDLNGTLNEFNSYIEKTIEKIHNSTRPKANIYWCDKFGNNRSDLWNSDEKNNSRLYYKDSTEKFDPASGVTTALRHCNYNPALETYVFIIFSATEVESSDIIANDLLAKIDEINKDNTNLHISVISDSSKYVDTAYLPKLIKSTQGTTISPQSANKVSADVLDYLGAGVVVKIISSTGLTRLPADFSEKKILDYYQEYKSGNGYYLTDTDEDGLENFKEIAFDSKLIKFTPDMELPTLSDCYDILEESGYVGVKQGYEKLLIFELSERIMNTCVLPIKSDPIKKDGDEDEYDDYDEIMIHDSNPLVCDVVEYNLKNDYINVTNTPDGIDNYGYGGSQMWFAKEGDIKNDQLVNHGCSAIALCDSLLYLQANQNDINTGYSMVNNEIEWTSYEEYVRSAAQDYITQIKDRGLNLFEFSNALKNYISDNNLKYKISQKNDFFLSKNVLIDDITKQLCADMPTIVLYCESEPDLEYTNISEEKFGSKNNFNGGHFMAITGIIVDKISGKTTLILSSWSSKVEIILDDYLENTNIFGGFIFFNSY